MMTAYKSLCLPIRGPPKWSEVTGNNADPVSGRALHGAVPAFLFHSEVKHFFHEKGNNTMNQNDVVGKETKDLLVAANRLSSSLDLMDHVLDFVESEISLGRKIYKSQICALLTILKSLVQQDEQALLAAENGLTEGGSAECPEG